jgi:hypothetical protein
MRRFRLWLLSSLLVLACGLYATASQHDLDITTGDANTGATMRAQINSALQALGTLQAGTTGPATSYPAQLFANTSDGFVYQRNSANSAWVKLWDWANAKPEKAKLADNSTLFGGYSSGQYRNAGFLDHGTLPLDRLPATLTGKTAANAALLNNYSSGQYRNASFLDHGNLNRARMPSGSVIRRATNANSTASLNISTKFTTAGSPPSSSGGTEILTASAAATTSGNVMRISGVAQVVSVADAAIVYCALWKDTTLLSMFGTNAYNVTVGGGPASVPFFYEYTTADTSSHTYSVRCGGITYNWNLNPSGYFGSGNVTSYLVVDEIIQ